MKTAIGYIRVSTDAQAKDDRFGMEAQREEILKYAERNGYDVIDWRIDDGVSGCDENPPALGELLYDDDVCGELCDAVIAFKSDRIARDTKLYFYRLYLLEKKGIELVSTQEQFDNDDVFANVLRAMMMFVAEQERKNINMRTTNGRKVKSSRGGYSGGKVPYGYRAENHSYAIEESEANTVRRIFDMRASGVSMIGIAHRLNADEVLTRSGGEWHSSQINSILSNKQTYQGMYRYGDGEWVQGQHPAILA